MSSTTVDIEIGVAGEGHVITADVEYEYSTGYPAQSEYPGGPPITPAEPAFVEIESVIYRYKSRTGEVKEIDLDFLLTDAEMEAIADEIKEELMP